MDAISGVVLGEVKGVVGSVLKTLMEAASTEVKARVRRLKSELNVPECARRLQQITRVKTLWNIDKPISLYRFYYPSKITFPSGVSKQVSRIRDLAPSGNVVVQGTVGQGKSIFLRYLCGQEVRKSTNSNRIPLFVELKRIQGSVTLRETIDETFRTLGFDIDDELAEFYFRSGRIVLLLDAFDEIDPSLSKRVLAELEALTKRYPPLQVIVTSRPDSGIQQSSGFSVFRLAPLGRDDHGPFLRRVCEGEAQAIALQEAIRRSGVEVQGLLTTPLLMTLLVVVYKATHAIPDTLPSFYEQLFEVLFLRHDKSKPGFSRKRETNLDDATFRRLFEAFSFIVRMNGTTILDQRSFDESVRVAAKTLGLEVEPRKFHAEITNTACLMQVDGGETSFIHKSVSEFHAASYVRYSSEEVAKSFYEAIATRSWREWEQEIKFLAAIDRYRFSRYFLIPQLSQVDDLIRKDGSPDFEEMDKALGVRRAVVLMVRDKTKRRSGWGIRISPSGYNYGAQWFIRRFCRELTELIDSDSTAWATVVALNTPKNPREISEDMYLGSLMNGPGLSNIAPQAFRRAVEGLESELREARLLVGREIAKIEFMQKLAGRSGLPSSGDLALRGSTTPRK